MPDRYKKIQPKLKPLPFVIIGVIIVAIVLLVVFLKDTPKEKFYKEYYSYGAYDLKEDHVFKEINFKTFNKKLNANEKMLVYFGVQTCQSCVTEVPIYNKEFNSEELSLGKNFKNIYYVNTSKLKEKDLNKLVTKYGYSATSPLFLYFEEGEVLLNRSSFTGTSNTTTQGQIYSFLKAVKQKQK